MKFPRFPVVHSIHLLAMYVGGQFLSQCVAPKYKEGHFPELVMDRIRANLSASHYLSLLLATKAQCTKELSERIIQKKNESHTMFLSAHSSISFHFVKNKELFSSILHFLSFMHKGLLRSSLCVRQAQ